MHTLSLRTAAVWTMLVACLLCLPAATRAQSGAETRLRVGIFSRAYVVQTFYRSAVWKARMQAMVQERNQAAIAGDSDKVDRINSELNNIQTLAQKQLSGDAPLTNIYDALKDEWPAIAKEAGVDIIVEPPVYMTPGAALTDVTSVIINHLTKRS